MRATVLQPYAKRCALRRELLDATVRDLLLAWRDIPGVHGIYAFGSYARGTIGPDSDLDLVVVQDTSLRRGLRDLEFRYRYSGNVGLDLFVFTPNEWAYDLQKTSFGRTIIADARRIDAD